MAADFNLSAAISLQLAEGAAVNLRKQIQEGFKAPLVVTGLDKVSAQIGKTKKEVEKPIQVPVSFILTGGQNKYDAIKKAIGIVPVEVRFNAKSVRENLTSAELQRLIGRDLTVKVHTEFSADTQTKLQQIEKDIKKLTKMSDKLKSSTKLNSTVGPAISGKKSKKRDNLDPATDIQELIKQTGELDKLNKQLFKKEGSYTTGGFYKFAKDQLKSLEVQIGRILALDPKLRKQFGDAKNALEQKFVGLNADPTGNATSSLRALYSAYGELDSQQKNLVKNNKKFGNSFDIKLQIDQINEAKSAIAKMFLSFDSADPGAFKVGVNAQLKDTRQLAIDATREMRAFSGLLSSLNKQKAGITATGGGVVSQKNIDAVIARAKLLQSSGLTSDQIRADDIFQELGAIAGVLKYVDISAQRAGNSIAAAVSKVTKGELKDTFGGRAIGLGGKVSSIGSKAQAAVGSATDSKGVAKALSDGTQEISDLKQKATDVQRQFQRLRGEIIKLEAASLNGPAATLKKFTNELFQLAKAGKSIAFIDEAVSKKLAEVANVTGLERKVTSVIGQINRLRHALESSTSIDVTDSKKQLDKLESDIRSRTGKFENLTPESLSRGVSSELFDIRASQRFNDNVDSIASKLRNMGAASENLAIEKIFSKNADDFQKSAERIGSSTASVSQKLLALKKLGDKTLIESKFQAEGGFFGSIAKSAGLATKRLAAFLIMAQGLYSIQGFFASALGEAVKIDKEFTKLEQVFNKDFSGTALETALSNINSQILTLGKTLGISTAEVANAAQILAQAGFAGKDLANLLDTIAKSQLGPTFGGASETAEAAIAIFQQFNLSIKQTQDALGGINRVAAKFAVEAKGITEGVRRAGGVFASSGDGIASFTAAFTLIKEQTREADEAIATGLRNISQRLQSSTIQKKLKETIGVDLIEDNQFIGFEKSIVKIGQALRASGANEKSPLFSQIREIIAGQRQGGRITPLLQNFEGFEKLIEEFRKGANSIEEDVAVAFGSIENKIARAKGAVIELYTELTRSEFVKFLVEAFAQITTFASGMLRVLNSVPGAIFAIGTAAKLLGSSRFVGQAVLANFAPRTTIFHKNKGGPIGFNLGSQGGTGLIPGYGPNKDSLLAYLTKGEYVIKRESVDKYGTSYLDSINSGRVEIANKGGPIGRNKGGLIPGFNTGGFANKVKSVLPKSFNNFFTKLFSQKPIKPNELIDFNYLEKELSSFGFSIKNLTKFIKSVSSRSEIPNATASFNPRTKNIGISPGGERLLPHEVGHSLYENKSKKEKRRIEKTLTKEDVKATKKRLLENKDLYANPKTGKIPISTLKSEAVADKFDNLVSFRQQSFKKQRKNQGDFLSFNTFQNTIGGSDGLEFKGAKSGRRKSANIIERIRDQESARQIREASGATPAPFTTRFSSGSRSSGGAASAGGGRFFQGKTGRLTLESGKLGKNMENFSRTILTTRGGLIGLASTVFALTGVLGQFHQGLSDLVLAMVTASAGFASAASAGSSIQFSKAALGFSTKESKIAEKVAGIAAAKRASIGAGKIGASAASFKASTSLLGAPALAVKASQAANASAAAASARVAAQKAGTPAILANIRGAGAAPGIVGAAKSSGAAAALKASGVPAAAAAKAFSTKLTIASIGVGVLFGALDYFISSVQKGADAEFDAAKTIEEANAAKAKSRFAGLLQNPVSQAGTVVGAAITGASIGGAPGLLVGAVVGGLIAFRGPIEDAFAAALPGIHDLVVNNFIVPVKKGLIKMFTDVSDTIYALTFGVDALTGQKLADQNAFAVNKSKRKVDEDKRLGKIPQLSEQEILNVATDLGVVQQTVSNLGGGEFQNLGAGTQAELKKRVQSDADLFNALGPEEQANMLATFNAMGYNFEKIAKTVGVELNTSVIKAAQSLSALSIFLEKMKQTVELSTSRLDGLSGGLQSLSDSKNNNLFAPTALLDVQAQGFDPSTLGFGTFDQERQNTNRLVRSFDPNLADTLSFENKTKKASRQAQQGLLGNNDLKIDPATINDFLFDIFDTASNGDIRANEKFNQFLEAQFEDVNAAIDSEGKIDVSKVNKLFDEFNDSIGSAANDQAKRIVELSNQYYDSYKNQLAQRFALEAEATEFLKNNVEKDRASFDITNTASGLTGDALAAVQGQQAGALDTKFFAETLRGTGLVAGQNGQVTVPQLEAALLASQLRARDAGNVANRTIAAGDPNDPNVARQALERKAQTEAIEEANQAKYKAGLSFIANGTNTATNAMEEFKRAADKAAISSKFLSNALLGSDDQLMQTVRGITAFAAVQEAFQQGGVGAARNALLNLNEESRQAIDQRIQQDPDLQNKFNEFIGAGPTNLQAAPEFNAAQDAIQQQRDANLALSKAITDSINPIIANTNRLQALYESQFQGLQGVVAQAQQTAQQLVGQIAALPQVIQHEANVNINILGADKIQLFTEAISEKLNFIAEDILHRGIEELKKENKGLR